MVQFFVVMHGLLNIYGGGGGGGGGAEGGEQNSGCPLLVWNKIPDLSLTFPWPKNNSSLTILPHFTASLGLFRQCLQPSYNHVSHNESWK